MISVSISINGNAIYTRSARNITDEYTKDNIYITDTGEKIIHNPDDGAVKLAKMLLDTIKEV